MIDHVSRLMPKPAILCPSCQSTVTSWHEEDLIDQHGHCADCDVQGVQGPTQATNTD
jgi:hypothetical protein